MANILIVEDELITQKIFLKFMDKKGFHGIVSPNGLHALELLKIGNPIDLIVTDVEMPKLNGLEMIDQIKAIDSLKNIPIIVVSAAVRVSEFKSILEKGVEFIIRKPFDLDELNRYILSCIERKIAVA